MASDRHLFREEAFARRGQTEPLDRLLRVTAPHEWAIVAALGLAAVVLVAWGLFGVVERSLTADCVLALPGQRHAVVSEEAGEVLTLLAEVGEEVQAGEPIARIRTPELGRHLALARARVAALEAEGSAVPGEMALARAELTELEALQESHELLVSPYRGEITDFAVAPGQTVVAGATVARIRGAAGDALGAVALVSPEHARRLGAGMSARVLAESADGGSRALPASVADVSHDPAPTPGWLAELGLEGPEPAHVVRVDLAEAPDPPAADGQGCEVRIIWSRDAPVRLIASARPG